MEALVFAFFTFCSTLIGGSFGIKFKENLHYFIQFAVGVLLGVCFFDVLPEIIHVVQMNNFDITPSLIAIVVGVLGMYILERIALIPNSYSAEGDGNKKPIIGLLNASGLSFHSFLDGVGIGLGFHVSSFLGIIIAIAVISHDFTDGLNTVTLMLINKNTTKKAIIMLAIDALTPLLGVLSTLVFVIPSSLLVIYLGFFLGFLLYIATSDLIPETKCERHIVLSTLVTITGTALIFLITRFV